MKHFFQVIVGIIVIFAFQCHSSGAEYVKIAVVDIEEFQKESHAFQKTRELLKKKLESLQKKLDEEKEKLLKLEEEFKRQIGILSPETKENKKKELDKKRRYYKYLYTELSQEMKYAEIEAKRKVGKKLERVVTEIGKREGYEFIFERRVVGLIYYDDSIDITDEVTKLYDKIEQ
jgi:outer membrane protein